MAAKKREKKAPKKKERKISVVLVLMVVISVLAIASAVLCMITVRGINPKLDTFREEYIKYTTPPAGGEVGTTPPVEGEVETTPLAEGEVGAAPPVGSEGGTTSPAGGEGGTVAPPQFIPREGLTELQYRVWKLAGNGDDPLTADHPEALGLLEKAKEKTVRLEELLWRIANFSVLIILLHVALTRRVATFLSDRRSAIREALQEAEKARRASKKEHEEVNRMLKKAQKEIEEIRASFATEGERERDRLIKNAEREAEKIKIQAEHAAVQEVRKARFALRAEAADLAVATAEEVLKKNLKQDDQKRIIKEFISKTSELK